MKKLFVALLIGVLMISCEEKTPEQKQYNENWQGFKVIVVDSCEYLIKTKTVAYSGYGYMAHKGNCKYCKERNAK